MPLDMIAVVVCSSQVRCVKWWWMSRRWAVFKACFAVRGAFGGGREETKSIVLL
jgi:hypothetical protein